MTTDSLAPSQTLPRARGSAVLSSRLLGSRSVLRDLRQSGSSKLILPRSTGTTLEAIALNTAGGITGGDRFDARFTAGPGTRLQITTQAAERVYRASPGQRGAMRTSLQISAGATLNWLPQETILYNGASFDRHLCATLDPDARLLLCESLCFGRIASGEQLTRAGLRDRIEVWRAGEPLICDALHLDGDIAAHLDRPTVGAGARAMATVVLVSPQAEGHAAALKPASGGRAGLSLVRPDVLFLRLLAADGYNLRQALVPILHRLSGGPIPRPWIL